MRAKANDADGRRLRVLVMDDEAGMRETLEAVLDALGFAVESAGDGAEAIARYRQARDAGQPFDVVILDLMVPAGMGGKETVERLRQLDPDVRAIVSSGYSTDPIMSEFHQYGFRGVVAKPYTVDELSQAIRQAMAAPTR